MSSFIKNLDQVSRAIKRIPKLAGIEAVNFSKERFRAQNWADDSTKPWAKRKRSRGSRQRDNGAVLVSSGRLKRSIRVISSSANRVIIGTDVPYAEAHNEGFRGTVKVKAHTRGKYNTEREKVTSKNGRTRTVSRKRRSGAIEVKSHVRKMNLPQRQFMGNSAALARKIERTMQAEFNRSFKSD